nr:hypothetical protein [Rhodococcus sp. (in: high G+C Gram-positive bacteria)]
MSSPQNRPRVPGWDVAISVTSLVFTVMLGGLGMLVGIFSLAFLDYCPPESCSADGAVTAVAATLVAAGVIGVAGLILTVVRIARKRMAWPFAVGTLLLCILTCTIGAAFYVVAVGG